MVSSDAQMLRYAITNLTSASAPDGLDVRTLRRSQWLQALHCWTANGVAFVQLREKDLGAGELYSLARSAQEFFASLPAASSRPALLLNGRPDLAVAAGAAGVHLTARVGELTPAQVRTLYRSAGLPRPTVSASCHTLPEVTAARDSGADLVLFGPIFEKRVGGVLVTEGAGLLALRHACRAADGTRVLALGGVTDATTQACLDAGAAGVAGIRLFG